MFFNRCFSFRIFRIRTPFWASAFVSLPKSPAGQKLSVENVRKWLKTLQNWSNSPSVSLFFWESDWRNARQRPLQRVKTHTRKSKSPKTRETENTGLNFVKRSGCWNELQATGTACVEQSLFEKKITAWLTKTQCCLLLYCSHKAIWCCWPMQSDFIVWSKLFDAGCWNSTGSVCLEHAPISLQTGSLNTCPKGLHTVKDSFLSCVDLWQSGWNCLSVRACPMHIQAYPCGGVTRQGITTFLC